MRYADGPTVEVEVHIDASPSRVWEIVVDIATPTRFSSELQDVAWLDGASGPAPGARFVGHSRHPAVGEWETTSVVVAYEPEQVFAWAVGDPERPAATWRFEVEPEEGGTLLRQWVRLGPGMSYLQVAIDARPDKEEKIIANRRREHRANMTATLEGVKALAEDSAC